MLIEYLKLPATLQRLVCGPLLATLILAGNAQAIDAFWQEKISEGNDYLNQQKLPMAEECFRQALKSVEKTTHTSDDLVECLEKLAAALTLDDKTVESTKLYQKARHLLEQKYGKDNAKVVPTLFALGSIFESEGDAKLAMGLYQKALAINEKSYGPFSPAVANSLHRLGRASFNAGHVQDAEHHYRQALSIMMQEPSLATSMQLESLLHDYNDQIRKTHDSEQDLISDFQTEVLKDKLGDQTANRNVLSSQYQKQLAIASIKQNIGPTKEKDGVDFPLRQKAISESAAPSSFQAQLSNQSLKQADAQTNEEQNVMLKGMKEPFSNNSLTPAYKIVSDAINQQHYYHDDEGRYEAMIAIDIKTLGANHPTVADDLSALALLDMSCGQYSQAKPLLIRALSIYEQAYGKNNLLVEKTRATLAADLDHLGATNKLAELYSASLTQADSAFNANSLDTARLLNELAFSYYGRGDLQQASTIYQWALSSTEAAAGDKSPLVAACLKDYANVLHGLGSESEAKEMLARAETIELKSKASSWQASP